ncbi:ABC transporter permease subunit [Vallitaleaceae bacterium 9-2]
MISSKQKRYIREYGILYILLLPVILFFIVYHILPVIGMKIAFEDFRIIGDNVFVGLKHFRYLFSSPQFKTIIINTLTLSFMKMILLFPVPIILAFLINEVRSPRYRQFVQVSLYIPHFLSWVIIAGVWISFLSPGYGAVNNIIRLFGGTEIDFMTSKTHIRWVLVASEMWRSAGWDSILYLAAILKIDKCLYEAATLDGASKFQSALYITLPSIRNTIITVFILNLGFFMNAGFDQVFNFMNPSVLSVIDILDTYTYRIGLESGLYSVATASSVFKGIIGFILIIGAHKVARKVSGRGLW